MGVLVEFDVGELQPRGARLLDALAGATKDHPQPGDDLLETERLGDVVVAAELEADMQHVVDTYACEWKEAVTNPETRKRFRQFVNSDKADPNVIFVQERGQIRPATPEERRESQPA